MKEMAELSMRNKESFGGKRGERREEREEIGEELELCGDFLSLKLLTESFQYT